jgi:hypothetical protein
VTRTWLSIRVDLTGGHGEQYWPRPGRIFAAARSHTFKQLADAIDDAFARWDRSHLQEWRSAFRSGRARAGAAAISSPGAAISCCWSSPEVVPVWAYLDSTRPAGLGPAVSASRAACQAESPG